VIPLTSEGLATHPDTERINAVRDQNSVFHGVLKFVRRAAFDRLVEKHGSDELVRRFAARRQLTALLFGPACARAWTYFGYQLVIQAAQISTA